MWVSPEGSVFDIADEQPCTLSASRPAGCTVPAGHGHVDCALSSSEWLEYRLIASWWSF